MVLFIITCLSLFIIAFLVGTAIQLLKIESAITDLSAYTESMTGKLFRLD